METINGKVKEEKKKGYALQRLAIGLVFAGAGLSIGNSVGSNNGNIVVYAKEASTTNLDETINKYVKSLESVYKNYSESYYSAKEYKKITKYYNAGIEAIKGSKTKTSIKEAYQKYAELIRGIQPSKLVNYQKSKEKSILKVYKSLITNSEYSEENLEKLDEIKDTAITKIYEQKTKKKVKKVTSSYAKELRVVQNLLEQTRSTIITYINENKDLSKNEKQAIIEQVKNLKNPDDIVSVAEEYGYEEKTVSQDELNQAIVDAIADINSNSNLSKTEKQNIIAEIYNASSPEEISEILKKRNVNVEKTSTGTITVEQINAKVNQLHDDYPKYSLEELRILVVAANIEDINDTDICKVFGVSSRDELKDKADLLDILIHEINDANRKERIQLLYDMDPIPYPETGRVCSQTIRHISDVYISSNFKEDAQNVDNLVQKAITERGESTSYTNIVPGDIAMIELMTYQDDIYDRMSGFGFKMSFTTKYKNTNYVLQTYISYITSSSLVTAKAESGLPDGRDTYKKLPGPSNNPLKYQNQKTL